MDFMVRISVSDSDKAALETYIAARTETPKLPLTTFIEHRVLRVLEQAVQVARAFVVAEVPYAAIKEALDRLPAIEQADLLDKLNLERNADGALVPKSVVTPAPVNPPTP
jgi:hypothetical protein